MCAGLAAVADEPNDNFGSAVAGEPDTIRWLPALHGD